MHNKIEVCKTCNGTGIEYDGAGHTCTSCSGIAAPVVERHPVATVQCMGFDRKYASITPEQEKLCSVGDKLYTAPPELAELQATIDRLTADNDRLKGGQGEPVAWIKPKTLEALTPSGMVYVTGFDIGGSIALYTSQPARESVVLPERFDVNNLSDPWDAGWNACLDKVKDLNQ